MTRDVKTPKIPNRSLVDGGLLTASRRVSVVRSFHQLFYLIFFPIFVFNSRGRFKRAGPEAAGHLIQHLVQFPGFFVGRPSCRHFILVKKRPLNRCLNSILTIIWMTEAAKADP